MRDFIKISSVLTIFFFFGILANLHPYPPNTVNIGMGIVFSVFYIFIISFMYKVIVMDPPLNNYHSDYEFWSRSRKLSIMICAPTLLLTVFFTFGFSIPILFLIWEFSKGHASAPQKKYGGEKS
jgi:hypothetical protein